MLRAELVKVEAFHQHLKRQLHEHYADFVVAATAPGIPFHPMWLDCVLHFFFILCIALIPLISVYRHPVRILNFEILTIFLVICDQSRG